RILAHRLAIGVLGLRNFALVLQQRAEIVIGLGVMGAELERLVIIAERFVMLADEPAGVGQVVIGFGEARVALDGLLIGGHGLAIFASLEVQDAKVVVRRSLLGIDFDRFQKGGAGFDRTLALALHLAEICVEDRVGWRPLDCLVQHRRAFLRIAERMKRNAENIIGIRRRGMI